MGNKSVTPAFSYDTVCSALSAEELGTLRAKFKMLCRNDRAGGTGLLDLNAFINKVKEHTCNHLVEQFLPRLFYLIAGGRDARTLRFEDYIGAVALFRLGTKEEKLKCKELLIHFIFLNT